MDRRKTRGMNPPKAKVARCVNVVGACSLSSNDVDKPEELRTFLDAFDPGDGELSDTEADYGNESVDNDDDDDGVLDEEEEVESDGENNVRIPVPRKQKFRNLTAVMDDRNFDPIEPQEKLTHIWTSRDPNDGSYEWTTDFHPNQQGRAHGANVVRNRPGPTLAARRCNTLRDLFNEFITPNMVESIVNNTNRKIQSIIDSHPSANDSNKYQYLKTTTPEEIHAFFGMLYLRAVLKQNLMSVNRLYQHQHSNPLFTATMSQNRFEFLFRVLQFDDARDREDRRSEDKFTAFREFFDEFNQHCAELRIPSELLAIDETLYPYRGKVSMRQYNPNKPAKYGILYRSLSDSTLPYTYNTLPYAGKPSVITERSQYVTGTDNYTKWLVKGAERFVDLRGRNISLDRYFTSMTVCEWLLNRELPA